MFSSPSQVRGSQATAQRRHNEILSGVQAERQAARARAASQSSGSIFAALRQRAGKMLIAAGQWLAGLAGTAGQQELESSAQS